MVADLDGGAMGELVAGHSDVGRLLRAQVPGHTAVDGLSQE